ncbi:TonB-dependent receptor [Desulfarculus baarsii DSM 2075]|uniref:TonB-dependent receptor n=2 Tax=Desulfarculus baarsii TaxID=453230 RepID=E1QE61_DESB2|nr:TonB-dependent receptor [Desulfarculus baarsii DSM 2075]
MYGRSRQLISTMARPRTALLAALLAVWLVGGLAWAQPAVAATPSASVTYDIPAGPLGQALARFSEQSGLSLSFDPGLTAGKTTAGLSGSHAPLDALAKLLAGSGLRVAEAGDGRLTLVGDGKPSTTLPGVTVTGQSRQDDPTVHDISTEVLRRTMAKDVADIFATDPSVAIGGGGRNAQRLYLRGIESSNLNVTIDGARQGRSLHQHRGDAGGIDPEILKRVEVRTGPAADNGPGALGGGIVFETVDAQDKLVDGKSVGATIRGGYATADESLLGGATAYGVYDQHFGLLAHVSGTNFEDYSIGEGGRAPNTAGQDRDYFAKFSMLDLAGHSLRLSAERNTTDGHYVWGSTGSDMGYPLDTSEIIYAVSQRDTYTLDHRYNPASQWIDTKVNLYFNDNSVDNQSADTKYLSQETGGSARNTFTFDLGPTAHRLSVGGDVVAEDSIGELADGSEKNNKSSNLGLFIQDRLSLGPLGLSFGARLDSYDSDFGPYNINGTEVSPNVGATYELIQGLTAFANYGQAVRGSGIIPGSWLTNINAKTVFKITEPESSRQIDGGLRYLRDSLFLADDRFNIAGTVFNTRLENSIEAVGMRGVINELVNGETIIANGWELRAGWGFGPFDTTMAFAHVDTEDDDGNPIGVVRRKAASTGDRFVWDNRYQPIEGVVLGYTLTAVGRLKDVPSGQPERPGYVLHAIQAQWQPVWTPGLTLQLVVDNIFDVRYADQTSIYTTTGVVDEPGRDIRLGFTYSF